MEDSYNQLKSYIEFWLSTNLNKSKESREETFKRLTPILVDLLKTYGFKLFSDADFAHVKTALSSVKMDKNMKKVLLEYNKSIEELMENK